MKATLKQCREGFVFLSEVFNGVKLPFKPSWHVGRVIDLLEQRQKEYQRMSSKLYIDAGGVFNGVDGFSIAARVQRREKESEADFLAREEAHAKKMNKLYQQLEDLDAKTVDVPREPIPLSWFPQDEEDEKGKTVDTKYPTVALAFIGTFVADDVGLDKPAEGAAEKKKR